MTFFYAHGRMPMTAKEQKEAAKRFAAKWAGKGYEKGECQKFWRGLLHDVFDVADPDDWLQYEIPVATGFVDAYIGRTKVLIEQKGFTHGLEDKAAMKQAMMYVGAMPDTMPVRYVVLSNFQEFWIYDKHAPEMTPVKVRLADLPKKLSVLRFLTEVSQKVEAVRDISAVDEKAGGLVGKLYKALMASYSGEVDERVLESLNMLCVRLVFCAYAEDSGVFPKQDQFVNYMRRYNAEAFRDRLRQLFRILNTDYPDRDPDDIPDLLEFPYVGSGLFDDPDIRIPRFTEETRELLLESMCADVNWAEINPTIFGAVFESTLSTVMRRKNGMHYTTVKNIHRVADPLCLWTLEHELDEIAAMPNVKARNVKLQEFQRRLGELLFLDPACGSGNFLTETYLSLRRLENRAIALRQQGQGEFDLGDVIRVHIDQFYGIEIDGFAVSVAQTALWIAESQMMLETERILHRKIDFLPLRRYAHIVKGNALRMDWNGLVEGNGRFNYIMGNPPFIGYSNQTPEQKEDMLALWRDEKGRPYKTAGKIDYVTGWYWKTASLMQGTEMRGAFVSTNSITQGEQVAAVWKPLKERFGLEIDFAWKTFVWDSEANEKAHVHVVIVGFGSNAENAPKKLCFKGQVAEGDREAMHKHPRRQKDAPLPFRSASHNPTATKWLFDADGTRTPARHINGYLVDADDVWIESRAKSHCDVPGMTAGNRPADGGSLIIEDEEYDVFVKREPRAIPFIKQLVGSAEFINNRRRYCLWLKDATPSEIRSMPMVRARVEACRADRLSAPDVGRRKLADTPHLFRETMNPDSFVIVPAVSSENRIYVPIGFAGKDIIASNLVNIVPDATLYHFGVLTSSVHMAWMRAVAGRLKSDYRYSAAIVYNNFPWPKMDDGCEGAKQGETVVEPTLSTIGVNSLGVKSKIEKTAQAILDARALYPDSSLADLYDPLTMPPELRKAHAANDAAVMEAYGFAKTMTESEIVAELFKLYGGLTCSRK